jgi:hypothetical protein
MYPSQACDQLFKIVGGSILLKEFRIQEERPCDTKVQAWRSRLSPLEIESANRNDALFMDFRHGQEIAYG